MKAVTWQGPKKVVVERVPDPILQEPTDIIIQVTSSGICGSDLHLYEVLSPLMEQGDILGHEPMGIVVETGKDIQNVQVGDRVVIPFNVSCGHCFMCDLGLQSQCETTQVREYDKGAALLGYTKLYGHVAGGQAEYLRVPQGHYGPIRVPEGPPDDRFLYLSDVLPTAWQAVQNAHIPPGGSVVVMGLGPIGDMSARIAKHLGAGRVIGVDLVPERLERARARGIETIDLSKFSGDLAEMIRDQTQGRGADSVIEAVGMEAHGAPIESFLHKSLIKLPAPIAEGVMQKAGVDRMSALYQSIDCVRRGGTLSLSGVYVGSVDPLPLGVLFDKQVQLTMGQANVKRWIPDLLPLLTDEDPLGVDDFATHRLPLDQAPAAYEMFQKKRDGAVKIVLQP